MATGPIHFLDHEEVPSFARPWNPILRLHSGQALTSKCAGLGGGPDPLMVPLLFSQEPPLGDEDPLCSLSG